MGRLTSTIASQLLILPVSYTHLDVYKRQVQDILNMWRVTRDEKDGLRVVTGPGPQTSFNLGAATIEELARRWPKN